MAAAAVRTTRASSARDARISERAEPRPLRRFVGLVAAVAICGAAGTAAANAQPSFSARSLCAAILPAKAPLPAGIGLPRLAAAALPISANASAHHALCRVGVYSPSDDARYNVNWYVFSTHALAVADLKALNLHTLYATVTSKKPAAGYPKPNYIVSGTFVYLGRARSIISITFVDGPAVVSASMLGGGTALQAAALAHWAELDLKHVEAA